MFAIITEAKKKCKHCGHTLLLGNSEKKICTNCGYYVYRNSKIEFKDLNQMCGEYINLYDKLTD